MQCLKDYIGIAGCGRPAPLSGLYINELPGISIKSIADLALEDRDTYLKVWDTVQKRALAKFESDVYQFFERKVKLKTILESTDLGSVIGDTIYAPEATNRGVMFDLTYGTNLITGSQYQAFWIQQLSFFSIQTLAGFELKVIDLQRKQVMDTFTMDIVPGWNYVNVEKRYATNRLWICYDSTLVTGSQHQLPYPPYGWFLDFNYSGFAWYGQAMVYGSQSSNQFVVNANQGQDTFGMSGIVSIICSYDALVCNNKNVFKNALLYKLGCEMMLETLSSGNMAKWTTINRARAQEILEQNFIPQYNQYLNQIVDGFDLDTADRCIECSGRIQTRFAIP